MTGFFEASWLVPRDVRAILPGTDFDAQLAQVSNDAAANQDKTMLAVEIPLILLAISTVALRVYSRIGIKRKLGVDDILIICGTVCAFGRTIISCMSADDTWGFDRNGPDQADELPYYRHIFERRIAYILAVTLVRFSVLTYYLRIFPPQITTLRRSVHILLFLTFCQFVVVLTTLSVACRDIGKLWTKDWLDFTGSKCFSSPMYSYSAAVGDSLVDSLIFALPIPYVWRLSKLRTRQRAGLVIVFGIGFVVCVVALLQIPFIRRRMDYSSYFGGTINLLIAIQISLSIVAASLPDLRALIARSFPKFSPLHHRSLATAIENAAHNRGDIERALGDMQEIDPRLAFEAGRPIRKPDWMRDSIPASLMDTRITHTELSRAISRDDIGLPRRGLPERGESSTSSSGFG